MRDREFRLLADRVKQFERPGLQIGEDIYQYIFAHSTQSGFENSILVEKNPCWLRRNVVFAEDRCSGVIKIVKGQRMTVNEFKV